MKRIVLISFVLILAAGALALAEGEAEPDPLEILQKVDTAIKDVKAVRYNAKSVPEGIAVNFVSAAEGETVVVGWHAEWGVPEKYFVHLKTSQQGSGEPVEYTGGGNGDMFFLIDHSAKKVYEDMDPAVMGSAGRTLTAFGMQEFVHDAPFDDEINAPSVEFQGKETVNGEECYKIHVDYGLGTQTSTWFFSTSDYLPRRRVQNFTFGEQGSGSYAIEVSNLEINPEIDAAIFQMKLPEGYEQIDDFAP